MISRNTNGFDHGVFGAAGRSAARGEIPDGLDRRTRHVLTALRRNSNPGEGRVQAWMSRWIGDGVAALEAMVSEHDRGFCFGVAVDDFPALAQVETNCLAVQAFASARAKMRPDAGQGVS